MTFTILLNTNFPIPINEYKARIECMNCGEEFTMSIKKGVTIIEAVNDEPCPNCGCVMLTPIMRL